MVYFGSGFFSISNNGSEFQDNSYLIDQLFLRSIELFRFVKNCGNGSPIFLVDAKEAFLLLFISCVASLKMWQDTGADSSLLQYVSGISGKNMAKMEKKFLEVMEYNLFLTEEDIVFFSYTILRSYHSPVIVAEEKWKTNILSA